MCLLLICRQILKRLIEHCVMEVQSGQTNISAVPEELIGTRSLVEEELCPMKLKAAFELPHGVKHLFLTSHIVILVRIPKNGVALLNLDHPLKVVNMLLRPNEVLQLLLIKVALGSLLEKVCRHDLVLYRS